MPSTPPPRTSFDSATTTTSTSQRPLLGHAQQGGDVKAKIRAVFKKTKSAEEQEQDQREDGKKKVAVPGSVKQGSFGGESSHIRMHM